MIIAMLGTLAALVGSVQNAPEADIVVDARMAAEEAEFEMPQDKKKKALSEEELLLLGEETEDDDTEQERHAVALPE